MMRDSDRYVIRPGRRSDAAELAGLQAAVQLQAGTNGQPHPGVAAWVEDLLDGHPTVVPDDFLVAEDRASGRPVASLVALRQDWRLAGVPLPVVQVELVGTAPEHRGNWLTRRLFAALHERCAADGVPIQMVEGLPYFYRRLGYDYALATGGAPAWPSTNQPDPAPTDPGGPTGPGTLVMRPATPADAPALAGTDRRLAEQAGRADLFCPRDAAAWRYEIAGRRTADIVRREVAVLADPREPGPAGVRGYLAYGARLTGAGELNVFAAVCDRPADWPRAAPAMLAHLGRVGRRYAEAAARPFVAIRPFLDVAHPLACFGPPGVPRRPEGWYVRTGDPVDLLTRLQPLLRSRWSAADLRWPEPELVIDLYGPAARLCFTGGELTAVTAARGAVDPTTDPGTHAAMPPGALLHLALGHRGLPEVLDAWPDCVPRDRLTERFLAAAFPRVPVRVWPRN